MNDTPSNDIRLVDASNPAWLELGTYAFESSPQDITAEDQAYIKAAAESRIFISYDGDIPLAQAIIHPMAMNVRGRVFPMGGVSGVASMPAGRRGGRIRGILTRAFAQMREDGQPVATLFPFRESFYERLGFVTMPSPKFVTLNPADLVPLLRMDHAGRAEHMRIADGFDRWVEFLRVYGQEHHGFSIANTARLETIRQRNRWWLILIKQGEETTGAMTYRLGGEDKPMTVHSFLARTVAARYGLLEWIARHTDQVPKARIRVAPAEQPEFWWPDLADAIQTDGEDSWGAPMGRIVSVEQLSGISAGTGEVALEISDPQCPWNEGTWTLRGAGGVLDVVPGGVAGMRLPIQGLSALLFNGLNPEVLRFRGWGDIDPAAGEHLRALFPPALPFLHEQF